jgi:hypothetical protein
MKGDEQLQARILTVVVRAFVINKQSTPRRKLILDFENEDIDDAINNVVSRAMLRLTGSDYPPEYLPTAASFLFCDGNEFRAQAKEAVTAVMHAMRRMLKTHPSEQWYTFEDLPQHVRELYPDSTLDEPALKLGLYLIQDLNVLSGKQMNPPYNTEVLRFQIGEGIITRLTNLDLAWDIMTGWHKPGPEPPGASDPFAPGVLPVPLEQSQIYLPAGSQRDAYVELRKIVQLAKQDMLIVDPYVDETLWELLTNVLPTVKIRVLTEQMKEDFRLEGRKFSAQHGNAIEVRTTSNYHDRFIIEDAQRCWHIGASIKDAGNKTFAFSELLRPELVKFVVADVENQLSSAAVVTL